MIVALATSSEQILDSPYHRAALRQKIAMLLQRPWQGDQIIAADLVFI